MSDHWKISEIESTLLMDEIYMIPTTETDNQPLLQNEETKPSKPILIITTTPLTQVTKDFIGKVMSAVSTNADKYEIVTKKPVDTTSAKLVLHFDPSDNGSDLYTPIIQDHATLYVFDRVSDIMQDTSLKRKLWECLKASFRDSQY